MNYPKAFLKKLDSVEAKRPRTVIQHILKHGHVTSQELKDLYGYIHAPRAVRDVRELGIPIETYRIKGTDGKASAAYKFGNPGETKNALSKKAGRTMLSKILKKALIEKYGAKCFVYFEFTDARVLQVDHRIPYEICGEQNEKNIENFMLLSPSVNRAKSWTCEHCKNWVVKDHSFCIKCFWAHPEDYEHIAGKAQRIITIVFSGDEVEDYKRLIEMSGKHEAQNTIKRLIHDFVRSCTHKR